MKTGDYVRTIYGIKKITDIICGQDIRFDNTNGFDEDLLKYHDYDGISKNSHTWKEIVIGEPKEKIIELIEVGDYVNGRKVVDKQYHYTDKDNYDMGEWCIFYENVALGDYQYDIKSIVTKEQFKNMEYEVE